MMNVSMLATDLVLLTTNNVDFSMKRWKLVRAL